MNDKKTIFKIIKRTQDVSFAALLEGDEVVADYNTGSRPRFWIARMERRGSKFVPARPDKKGMVIISMIPFMSKRPDDIEHVTNMSMLLDLYENMPQDMRDVASLENEDVGAFIALPLDDVNRLDNIALSDTIEKHRKEAVRFCNSRFSLSHKELSILAGKSKSFSLVRSAKDAALEKL